MSLSAGTGQPITLKCQRCIRSRSRIDYSIACGRDLVATGRTRPLSSQQKGHGGPRVTLRRIEILCRTCDHRFFSRHKFAEELLHALPLREPLE